MKFVVFVLLALGLMMPACFEKKQVVVDQNATIVKDSKPVVKSDAVQPVKKAKKGVKKVKGQ